jgi:hypothetical protein
MGGLIRLSAPPPPDWNDPELYDDSMFAGYMLNETCVWEYGDCDWPAANRITSDVFFYADHLHSWLDRHSVNGNEYRVKVFPVRRGASWVGSESRVYVDIWAQISTLGHEFSHGVINYEVPVTYNGMGDQLGDAFGNVISMHKTGSTGHWCYHNYPDDPGEPDAQLAAMVVIMEDRMNSTVLIASMASALLLVACDSAEQGNTNTNQNANSEPMSVGRFEYSPESVTLDDATSYLEIVGIYAPDEAGESCSNLPVSEVRHRVWLSNHVIAGEPRVRVHSFTPITREEFAQRAAAVPNLGVLEFAVDPIGVMTISNVKEVPVFLGEEIPQAAEVRLNGSAAISWSNLTFGSCGPHQCDDGVCGGEETLESCMLDCGCGNGVLEVGEECDVGDFGGATCEDYGLTGEGLVCNLMDCRIYTTNCGPRPE